MEGFFSPVMRTLNPPPSHGRRNIGKCDLFVRDGQTCHMLKNASPCYNIACRWHLHYVPVTVVKILPLIYGQCKHVGRDSSVGIATSYGLDGPGIESLWGRNFRIRQDRPWGPPNILYNGYRVFPGGKAAGEWSWPPTLSSAEVKERVALYLYSPFEPS